MGWRDEEESVFEIGNRGQHTLGRRHETEEVEEYKDDASHE